MLWDRLGRWIRGQSRSRWIALQTIENLTNVVLTTVFVTLAISANAGWRRILLWGLACMAVTLLTVLAGKLGKLREAIFPENPRMVLRMMRTVGDAMIDENKLVPPNSSRERIADARKRIEIYLLILS